MRTLTVAARLYVGAVIALGGLALACFAPQARMENPGAFLFLLLLSTVTAAFKVNLPLRKSGSTMSVSYAVDFTALLLLGPHETMLIGMASAWSQCTVRVRQRNPVHRTLFSMASLVLTVQAAGHVYGWMTALLGTSHWMLAAITLVCTALTYFLANTTLVAAAVSLTSQRLLFTVWHDEFLWSAPGYFVGAAMATACVALASHNGFWLALVTALPLFATYRAYAVYLRRIEDEQQQVRQISDLHLATVEALALAIDAKDQMSHTHIRRMQIYAAGLATALGLPDDEIQGVRTAALLHDIGKLAVPEHILSKPGPLTHEEFQKVRIHPQVGSDVIGQVPFPYPVAPLVLGHHERWDGRGYPNGLKGEAIPLGARILAVVDYFDALTSERPYHKAMSYDAALRLLRQEAGRGLDPFIVAKFIDLLPALREEAERSLAGIPAPPPRPLADDMVAGPGEAMSASVFEDIALAHREIYALYEIAQAIGTSLGVSETMQLISSKLTNLIPFSCCALFLQDEDGEMLRCRYATGSDAEIVQRIAVRNGHGMTGWVARNRRTLVNARPSSDLEASEGGTAATRLMSALACPLLVNDRFIGTLAVYDLESGCYNEDHRRLLERISEQAAAVIYNSMLFEQTQEESLTDPLTGLPNTRFLATHVARELARAARLKSEVSMIVLDLDGFKEINDHYGHFAGDRALQAVAEALRNAIRPYDICARYAGDEFIVVLSGCGAEEAENKRRDLQAAVEMLAFSPKGGMQLPLAISAGAAVFPSEGDTYETLLAAADARMYRDKAARKRAEGCLPVIAPPRLPGEASLSDVEIERAAAGVL